MCKTTNRGTQTAAPAAEQVRLLVKPKAVPAPPPGLFPVAYTLLDNNTDSSSDLSIQFNLVKAKSKYKRLPFALIDYTGGSAFYLGHNDKKQTFVASHAKIGILFAALWLRKTVKENAKKSTASTIDEVLDELTNKWSAEEKPFPDRFKKNVLPSKTWPPDLKKIFTGSKQSNGEWLLDFTSTNNFDNANRKASLAKLAPIDNMPENDTKRNAVNALGYRDRLELMIGWSDNMAAGSCLNAMGFQFVNGCLMKAGLYNTDKTNGGGLWITKNYDKIQDGSDFQQTTAQGSTAQVSANCFWLAANKKLIDQQASEDWLIMTAKQDYTNQANPIKSYTRSFIGDELSRTQLLDLNQLNSKLGIYYLKKKENGQDVYYDFHYSDAACVEEDRGGGNVLKYAIAICFSGTTDNTAKVLQDLSFELEKVVKAAH